MYWCPPVRRPRDFVPAMYLQRCFNTATCSFVGPLLASARRFVVYWMSGRVIVAAKFNVATSDMYCFVSACLSGVQILGIWMFVGQRAWTGCKSRPYPYFSKLFVMKSPWEM